MAGKCYYMVRGVWGKGDEYVIAILAQALGVLSPKRLELRYTFIFVPPARPGVSFGGDARG